MFTLERENSLVTANYCELGDKISKNRRRIMNRFTLIETRMYKLKNLNIHVGVSLGSEYIKTNDKKQR